MFFKIEVIFKIQKNTNEGNIKTLTIGHTRD